MNFTNRYFVNCTDTEFGKSVASCYLLKDSTQLCYQTVGYKPVGSGSEMTTDGLSISDALALKRNSSLPHTYSAINPYTF
ncbi:ATP-dependent dethiobiotin synthetase BioD, partial [Salmonella enterica]